MIRKGTYTIDEVRAAVINSMFSCKKAYIIFNGDRIKASSQRYQLFFTKGTTCVECGLKGSFFAKEKAERDESFHLNLYGIDENGKEILMTKDHIIPKSKGGRNTLSNYQCMCAICNLRKGNKI